MAISLTCPGCDTALNVAESLIGKTIKCKTCGEMIPVAAPKAKVAKAVPAKATVAKSTKPARMSRDDDEEFDAPRPVKGGSKAPLFIGLAAGLLLILGGGAAAAFFVFGTSTDVVVKGDAPLPQAAVQGSTDRRPPTPPDIDTSKPVPAPAEGEEKAVPEAKGETKPVDKPAEKAPAKPAEQEPSKPASAAAPPSGVSSDEWNRKMMLGELDDIALKQCKHSTVYIEVQDKFGGGGQGSGWFGIEKNIVITNAHVISMIAPNSPPPAKITIYIDSGENGQNPGVKQREIPHQRIKILAVDRDHDIAILEISGEDNLPPPLKVKPTARLKDRQGLSVIGFPLGSTMAASMGSRKQPSVSVRSSSVAALRYDDYGILRNLQVQGGISSGNSGGPQFDADGNVIGMTVAVMVADRTIGLAVPTEHIQGLLAGRIDEVVVDTAYNDNGKVKIPVSMTALDPLKRLKKLGVAAWVGDTSTTIRPPGEQRTGMVASDKDYQEIEFKYDPATKTAKGDILLPPLAPGQSYYVQPYYSNTIIPKYYLPGTVVAMKGPPVDAVAANLQVNLRVGPVRPFTLNRTSALNDYAEGEGADKENRLKIVSMMKGTEAVIAPDPADALNAARLRLKYEDGDLKADVANNELKVLPPRDLARFKEGIRNLEAFAYVNRQGGIYRTRTNLLSVQDPLVRTLGAAMSADCLGSLQECSIPMPNREVKPGETWTATRTLVMQKGFIENLRTGQGGPPGQPPGGQPRPPGGGQPPTPGNPATGEVNRREFPFNQEVNYTYQGSRTRGGRKEAVIKVTGKVTAASGKPKESASGYTKGYAFIDITTGIVVDADIESEYDLDTSALGVKLRTYSLNKYNLTRGGSVR